MARDPAFLFYDGDAAKDVSHMNRLERGCYFDLIQAQRKFGGYTVEQARKILGKDFEACWGALEMVLSQEDGKYFIDWVAESISKRKTYAENQRKRIQDYWDKKKKKKPIPRNNRGSSTDIPYEEEKENEKEIEDVNTININVKFAEIWGRYPDKDGRKEAIRHFKATVKTKEDWLSINKALDNYLKSRRVQEGYIKKGATWFNNWQDWIKHEEPRKLSKKEQLMKSIKKEAEQRGIK